LRVLIILFSPAAGTLGSLTRTLSLARAFSSRGHEIAFVASGRVADAIAAKGYIVHRASEPGMFGLPPALSRRVARRSERGRIPVKEGRSVGSVWFVFWLSGLLKRGYLSRLVAFESAVARGYKAELLVTEMDLGAYLTAQLTGIPLLSTYASVFKLGKGSLPWRKARRSIERVVAAHGRAASISTTTPEALLDNPASLKIIPSIPELDGSDPERPDIRYVGNLIEPVREAKGGFALEEGLRYVFIYLGTGSISMDRAYEVLPRAFAPFGGLSVCVADPSRKDELRVGKVRFLPYLPSEEILARAELTICHGGLNTITQSIEAGVPLLLFPGPIFERRFNAGKVAENGAGFVGELSDFNAEWIRDKFERRAELRDGVARLRASFARMGGAEAAVKAAEDWLGRQRPETTPRKTSDSHR
jgi:UDP:flavonoid glycosyltransferase YjiC (YdhE family)